MQFFATGIEGANHRVDLLDSLACLLVGLAVLRILEATSEVALCSCPCRCHVVQGTRNVHVTHAHPHGTRTARIVIPIVFRNEYQTALRNLSREGRCDLYVRTLAYAWRWTVAMPWQDRAAVDGQLIATNALTDSTDAEREGVRLELP
jgi:hypothetical protein